MTNRRNPQRQVAPYNTQLQLFEHSRTINCNCNASARNAYGEAAQEIVYKTLDITPIKINGNYLLCFDGYKAGTYYEIKSVKNTGKLVIYDWRILKEKTSGVLLKYAIMVHSLKGQRADIIGAMADRDSTLYILPAVCVHRLAKTCPLNKHKSYTAKRSGYSREGYSDGYRNLDLKQVLKLFSEEPRKIQNFYGLGIISVYERTSYDK